MPNKNVNAENQQLKEQIRDINNTLQEFYEAYSQLTKSTIDNINKIASISNYIKVLQVNMANLKYELMDPLNIQSKYFYPEFRSDEETLYMIMEEQKSLARFGDGEFSIAFSIPRQKFQRLDDRLSQKIWEVLNGDTPENLIIAIANQYGNLDRYNEQAAQGIRSYMTEETRRLHEKIIPLNKVYSDAYITRPYVLHADMFSEMPSQRFDALKQIWKDKRVIIVEGAQTRLGVGNDLFEQAKEIRRILAPAVSSFDRYEDIYRECLKWGDSVDLFLLAIGPSSGVLAYDLALKNFQAVDVGHIDLEYEWFLAGKGTRVPIPYKYNNEITGGDIVSEIHDQVYESQVIASFA